jgi:hypothetical protein
MITARSSSSGVSVSVIVVSDWLATVSVVLAESQPQPNAFALMRAKPKGFACWLL